MKRISFLILFVITLIHPGFSQSYKEQLKKVNDFLKTFDNGYYGYLEIKDGYLYDRFQDGNNYCKAKLSDIGKANEKETNRKVELYCNGTDNCMFSTFTNQNYNSFSFSQSTDFNTKELITFLDDLVTAYKKTNAKYKDGDANIDYAAEKRRQESLKLNADNSSNNTTSEKNNSTGNYQSALKKLNDYLLTFDNGYYGYFEVINDELFIRLKTGFYCQAKIKDLDKAYVIETNKKIEIRCLDGKSCMNATYTSGKTSGLKMYQDKNFDSGEFIQLINDLISILKKGSSKTPNSSSESETVKSETSKTNPDNSTNNTSGNSTSIGNYQTALKKLNDYLKTFDNGYYGYFEVKDGYIYDRFKAGKYNKFKMEDMEGAVIQEQYSRVIFKCKGDNKCISTDWKENGKEEYTQFTQSSSYNYQELATLLNNFRDAYLGKNVQPVASSNSSSSSKSTTSGDYPSALKALNDYLKTFDVDRYRGLEIKDGYMYSNYSNNNYSKAKIEDLDKVVFGSENKSVKLTCKNGNECIYSTITGKYHDYFNFQSFSGKSAEKLKTLLENFMTALKGQTTNTSSNSISTREQLAKERQQTNLKTKKDTGDEDEDWDALESAAVTLNKSVKEAAATSGTNANYQVPLQKLNDYLKTFNAETYRDVEVKDGKVYFSFFVYGAKYNSSIDISELKNNTIITIGKSVGSFVVDEVKISCKGGSKCFYSNYSKGGADHFRFFSHTIKDFTKMEELVREFINSLK